MDINSLQIELARIRHENVLLKTELHHAYQKNEREVKELQQLYKSKVRCGNKICLRNLNSI